MGEVTVKLSNPYTFRQRINAETGELLGVEMYGFEPDFTSAIVAVIMCQYGVACKVSECGEGFYLDLKSGEVAE